MFRGILQLKRQERLILNQLINNDYCEDKFNKKIRDLVRVRNKIESEAQFSEAQFSEAQFSDTSNKMSVENEPEVKWESEVRSKIPPVKMTRFK